MSSSALPPAERAAVVEAIHRTLHPHHAEVLEQIEQNCRGGFVELEPHVDELVRIASRRGRSGVMPL